MASQTRGRKRKYDYDIIKTCLVEHQEELFFRNNGQLKLREKNNEVWKRLSYILNIADLNPRNLYDFVANNRSNFRNEYEDSHQILNESEYEVSLNNSNVMSDQSLNDSIPLEHTACMSIPESEFKNLVWRQSVTMESEKGHEKKREVWRLKKFQWEPVINKHYRQNNLDSTCSFKFSNHWLNENFTGVMKGKCNSGTEYEGFINNFMSETTIIMNTTVKKPTGKKCGVDYLRGQERVNLGKKMVKTNEQPFNTAVNRDLQIKKRRLNPAESYNANVLSNAKSEYKNSKNIHPCPFRSLEILSRKDLKTEIVFLSSRPFMVMYIVSDQQRNYRAYSLKEGSFVAADATGSLVKKFLVAKTEYTGPIFNYHIVVNDGIKQYPVFQMLSDSHSAFAIATWLNKWIDLGNPIPRKFVTDGSRALLLAVVTALTRFRSVNDYVNSMFNNEKPNCQITIDFAHFIHNFAIFLRNVSPGLKRFYLCCVGLLLLSSNRKNAEFYLESILYILLSDRCGNNKNGDDTICQKKIDMLNDQLTGMNHDMRDVIDRGELTFKIKIKVGSHPKSKINLYFEIFSGYL